MSNILISEERVNSSSFFSSDSTPVLVLLSGGIDSTCCVEYYRSRRCCVSALFVNYGQPQAELEQNAVSAICAYYNIPLREFAILGSSVSAGYIRARNALLLTLGLMHFGESAGIIALGIHSGTPYADCLPEFTSAMQGVFNLYENGNVRIDTPFLTWTKQEILLFARANTVPLHMTYSSNPDDIRNLSASP